MSYALEQRIVAGGIGNRDRGGLCPLRLPTRRLGCCLSAAEAVAQAPRAIGGGGDAQTTNSGAAGVPPLTRARVGRTDRAARVPVELGSGRGGGIAGNGVSGSDDGGGGFEDARRARDRQIGAHPQRHAPAARSEER